MYDRSSIIIFFSITISYGSLYGYEKKHDANIMVVMNAKLDFTKI